MSVVQWACPSTEYSSVNPQVGSWSDAAAKEAGPVRPAHRQPKAALSSLPQVTELLGGHISPPYTLQYLKQPVVSRYRQAQAARQRRQSPSHLAGTQFHSQRPPILPQKQLIGVVLKQSTAWLGAQEALLPSASYA